MNHKTRRHFLQTLALLLVSPLLAQENIYTMDGSAPFRQMFTKKNATYGVTAPEYHSIELFWRVRMEPAAPKEPR